ncbi:phage holin family protein [Sphingomonas sp. SUN039]|uniref:phage holin family protein n=1 Tax=Sphingomonas sp. SUN039 TaxID=2937787 RepID=UPI002164381F|nr:phage holin family protein [Sphingomonas sp. SUN039]UVO53213.1 phage holin family protein [Sphingomonas sp. SUN039]
MAGATVDPVDDSPVVNGDAAGRQSVPDLFAELVDDGRDWLNAEAAVFRAEARRRLIVAAIGLGLLTLSATLLAGTLVALLVGAMFALTPVVGAGWATAIVVAVAVLVAAIAAQAGRLQLRKLTREG